MLELLRDLKGSLALFERRESLRSNDFVYSVSALLIQDYYRILNWYVRRLLNWNVLLLCNDWSLWPIWSSRPEQLDRVLGLSDAKDLAQDFLLCLRVLQTRVLLSYCLGADLHREVQLAPIAGV